MSAAAFRATYSDWKVIKGRKVVQIVFETPIEQADLAYKVVGGMPNPAEEKWFAIARLVSEEASQAPRQAVTQTAPAGAKSYAQRIALLCKEPRFWRFLDTFSPAYPITTEQEAAEVVRKACQVSSRSDIVDGSPAASRWRDLSAEYDVWRRGLA